MDTLRLAILSTPRSGNTWLRHMLAQSLDLVELAVHLPDDVDWQSLPPRAVLQLHWLPEAAFVKQLEQHGFRPIVLARHPLDVLISILAFSQHDNSTPRWLAGAGGDEHGIAGASPQSEAFLDYATGARAGALLRVSADWWQAPGVYRVRYEDLVRDTAAQLSGILDALGVSPRKPLADVIGENTADHLRTRSVDFLYHVWQARPGVWKELLTARAAQRIVEVQQKHLSTFGYTAVPDESLTASEAQQAWERLETAALKRSVNGVKRVLADAVANRDHDLIAQHTALVKLQQQLEQQSLELQQMHHVRDEQAAAIAALDRHYQASLADQRAALEGLAQQFAKLPWQQIGELSSLGPWSLGTARAMHRWSRRFPLAASGLKSLLGLSQSILGRRKDETAANRTGPHQRVRVRSNQTEP